MSVIFHKFKSSFLSFCIRFEVKCMTGGKNNMNMFPCKDAWLRSAKKKLDSKSRILYLETKKPPKLKSNPIFVQPLH